VKSRLAEFFDFFETLEHELTHALVATLMGSPPQSLKVTQKRGGEISLSKSNLLIALAPYLLPLWTGLSVGICFIAPASQRSSYLLIPWFLSGLYLYRLCRELRPYQTDFATPGFTLALLLSVLFQVVFLVILFTLSGSPNWSWFVHLPESGLALFKAAVLISQQGWSELGILK